jgi:two-component system, NtrC family, sensor kinase
MDKRSRMIRLKLTGKLMVVMAAILIFCQLLLSATHLYQSDKQLHQQHQARLDATLKTLAQSVAIDVWNFNAGSLEVLVGPHLTDPGIRKIALNDTNGNSLELPNQSLRNSSDDAVLEKTVELTLGGQQTNVGMLKLYSSTDYIAAQLKQTMLRQTGELVLLILILAAGLSLALSKLVLQPLRKLNAALTAAVNSQDGVVHNPLFGLEDEFEEVAVSIAGLSGRLSGDIKTISQAKTDLQVEKERTEQALNHLKQTQEALLQSEKQASLGSLVAGVAHEVNTPLGVVITSITCINDMVQQLLQDTEAGTLTKPALVNQLDKLNEATHLIISNTNRASQLINNFKLLSQEQHGEAQRWFNLSSYIQDVVASMQDQLAAHNIKLQLQIEPDIVLSSMPGLYAQLVSSLLSNVMEHAFPSGQGGNCLLRLALHPHEVCLSCSDQGVGIATELQKRVFDPFYTSKLGVGSSGLGMAIAYRIVKFNLKGDIQVHSVEQQGTTFDIRIPYHAAQLN